MAIDNFQTVRDNILKFVGEGEFYLAMILRRRKDVKGKMLEGVNEDNRLIKHYFIYDREYLDRKRDAIIALCEQNNARAYILPQRRSHDLVMWALHNKTGEILKEGAKNTHFDHLIRSCVAGMHEVPSDAKWHKRWVIDIDRDEYEKSGITPSLPLEDFAKKLQNKIRKALAVGELLGERGDAAKRFMPKLGYGYCDSDITLLPTPHGFHIVTPPFNREPKAMHEYFGFEIPTGWIKPDAMALLYSPSLAAEL